MKITCLIENTQPVPEIAAEHGLSLYTETEKHCILFDMGQTEQFAGNAAALNVDLSRVDVAVLSHGHYDHGGGMARFLAENDHAPVYHSCHAFGGHYHGEKYIGLDAALQGNPRLVPVAHDMTLDDEISLHTGLKCIHPIESAGLSVKIDSVHIPEAFEHEQYLLIREKGKRILISGCSHRGVSNIAAHFRPDVLVGGFHLMKLDPGMEEHRCRLENLAAELLATGAVFYTGHCTGEAAYAFLKERMGNKLNYLRSGDIVHI